jgi:hypothetical protein
MNRHLIRGLTFLFPLTVFAQGFDAGVKIGIPVTQFFDTGDVGSVHGNTDYSSGTRRYTAGLSGEWRLTRSLGFEVDAMYHRLGYNGTDLYVGASNYSSSVIHVTGNSWDFPLLAKYRFGHRSEAVLRPFLDAGATLRYIGPVNGEGETTTLGFPTNVTTPVTTSSPSEFNTRFYSGVTAGAGVEFTTARLHFLPELRYTHWTTNMSGPDGVLHFVPNQLEVLVGVDFGR